MLAVVTAEYYSEKETELEVDISEQNDEERHKATTVMPTTAVVSKLENYQTGETPAILLRCTRGGELTSLLSSAMKAQTADMETRKVEDATAKEAAAVVTPPSALPEEPTRLGQE